MNEVNEKKVGVNNMVSCKRNKKLATKGTQDEDFDFDFDLILVFNATFYNISAISWRPVLVVEEAGENHRPWASNW